MAESSPDSSWPLRPVPEVDENASVSAASPTPSGSSTSSRFSSSRVSSIVSSITKSNARNKILPSNMSRRVGYQRMTSNPEDVEEMARLHQQSPPPPFVSTPELATLPAGADGLGISVSRGLQHSRTSSSSTIRRVPVGSKRSLIDLEGSYNHLPDTPPIAASNSVGISPWGTPAFVSGQQPEEPDPLRQNAAPIDGTPLTDSSGHFSGKGASVALNVTQDPDDFDDGSFYKKFGEPPSYCWSKQDVHTSRRSWLSITIFTLSIYSTVMSGIWLVAAIVQPRWGHGISSRVGLQPSTATLLTALFAKTIEMSFVTVFVSCLGQVLTRRAFLRSSRGVSLAEITMRSWVFQPGYLITHWQTMPHAALTVLGALSLTATTAAMFYTTASDAMVAPKLKYGDWTHKLLSGYVRTSYANSQYFEQVCPAVFTIDADPDASQSCMNIEFSGQSNRNLQSYMTTWTAINENGTSLLTDLSQRPPGTNLLYDNITMVASWIETEHSNVTAHYQRYQRIINNVTMAIPHPGVYAAATSPLNGILQPEDLAGVGEYSVRAAVVSPAIGVMCVNMAPEELAPLVYTEWPHALKNTTIFGDQPVGYDGWTTEIPAPMDTHGNPNYLNATVVDDIFRWGEKYQRWPPVFQLYPADYNMIVNATVYETDGIYILGKSPLTNYTLCELRSWLSPNCSTEFIVSGTDGASMNAHCEDPRDKDTYLHSLPPGQDWPPANTDWPWLAQQWELSMEMDAGLTNSNASNARFLTQLALTTPELPSYLPSIAEALAVYAGSTAVIGSIDSPFVHYWQYDIPENILGAPGAAEAFNASLITQQYTSGHTSAWQNIFYLVLVLVFAVNVLCLLYFLLHSGLVTDFTEPINLFALAVNSPPSAQLKGSCGGGPRKDDLAVPWRVAYAPSANHYFFQEVGDRPWAERYKNYGVAPTRQSNATFKGSSYKRLSTERSWLS